MKRMILAGMMIGAATLAACSSSTNSTTNGTSTPTDGSACNTNSVTVCSTDATAQLVCNTATGKYVATKCGAGTTCQTVAGVATCKSTSTADAISTTDTTGGDGTGTKDTATKDIATKDIPATPSKCAMSDQTCIQTCAQDKCATPISDCQGDADCASYYNCLGKCQQGVSPPAEVTGSTCEEKCTTLSTPDAQKKLSAFEGCIVLDCIQCNASDADYQNCVAGCAQAKCADSLNACKATTGCYAIITCMGACKDGDQACLQACVTKAPAADAKLFMTVNTCFSGAQTACQ